jgi:hypothetical protein
MKNIFKQLIFLLTLSIGVSVMADYYDGYRVTWDRGGPAIKIIDPGVMYVRMVTTNYDSFGYFTYNNQGNILEQVTLGNEKIGEYTPVAGFEAGENVGFWLSRAGQNFYTMGELNPVPYMSNVAEYGAPEPFFSLNHLGPGHVTGHCSDGRFYVAYNPGETAPAPAGQPLPGTLVSVFAGLGVAGIFLLKRKVCKA